MKRQGSLPEKPAKIGRISKRLIGRCVEVGYVDALPNVGFITSVSDGRMWYYDVNDHQIRPIDSREQIIRLGSSIRIELDFGC